MQHLLDCIQKSCLHHTFTEATRHCFEGHEDDDNEYPDDEEQEFPTLCTAVLRSVATEHFKKNEHSAEKDQDEEYMSILATDVA